MNYLAASREVSDGTGRMPAEQSELLRLELGVLHLLPLRRSLSLDFPRTRQAAGNEPSTIQLLGNGPIDSLHHSIAFFQNFSTVKAQHLQTKRDQVPITTPVFQGVIACQVLGAIHFHDQFCPWREEIHNVLTDGFLPIELDAKKLFIPQA